jgi:hypothetical protein
MGIGMLKRLIVGLWLCLAAAAAHATTVLPLYLDEIIARAAVAFQGTCVDNRSGRDPQTGLVATFTTFEVHDVLKGDVSASYTIKQIGGQAPGEALRMRVQGVPTFTVGEEYVVFLAGVSSAGFSSPVGLGQGRFSVIPEAGGARVSNGRDFKEMTARMSPKALPEQAQSALDRARGPVRELGLDDFKRTVRGQIAATAPGVLK